MQSTQILKPVAAKHAGCALNVTAVYEDIRGREWAMELWRRLSQLMGNDAIANNSWSLVELNRPKVFSEAVSAATLADVLVVSFHAGKQLPAVLCAWIDAWLPRRQRQEGALIALIGVTAGQPDAPSEKVEEYLRAVARRGRLDFLLREHVTAATGPATSWPGMNPRLESNVLEVADGCGNQVKGA